MFFDVFQELCKKKGVSPTQATIDCGAPKSNVTYWKKNGTAPTHNVLNNMANYFGVTIDYLLGNSEQKNIAAISDDNTNTYNVLAMNGIPGVHTVTTDTEKINKIAELIEIANGLTPEQIEKLIQMAKII